MKIDDANNRNYDMQHKINNIDSFDKEVYHKYLGKSEKELIKQITEKVEEINKYPKINIHAVEFYNKYTEKYADLKKKFDEHIQIQNGI